MTVVPGTHYVRSADGTKLAYRVTGEGQLDLAMLRTVGVPVDLL